MVPPPFLPKRRDDAASLACYARYESDAALAQYCDAHYGPEKFGIPNFSVQLIRLCAAAAEGIPKRSALDLGCAVGRASFELTRHFERVTGVDFSARFIATARRLKDGSRIHYRLAEEGDLGSDHKVGLEELDLAATAARADFHQGDVQNLEGRFGNCDLVLAANLIDRLSAPGHFLKTVHCHLAVGGLLAIASPYNWLEEFTPRRNWLGGRFRAGTPVTSAEGLAAHLADRFVPLGQPRELDFVIRETARKYQHCLSQLTLWQRRR